MRFVFFLSALLSVGFLSTGCQTSRVALSGATDSPDQCEGAACAPSTSQLQKIMEENPDLLLKVIEKNPDRYMKVVSEAAQKKRQSEEENDRKDEMAKREEEYRNPKQPVIDNKRAIEGPKSAPVTIVEYTDLQCPFCKRGHVTMKALRKEYPDDVRILTKNFPIERIHPFALKASQYYEAIALQDIRKAARFLDVLFTNQDEFSKTGEPYLKEAAKKSGADVARALRDLTSDEVRKRIEADRKEAESFGFRGTPGYLINGVSISGAYPVGHFKQIIETHLQRLGRVKVVPKKEPQRELEELPSPDEVKLEALAGVGKALHRKHACEACHSLDGRAVVGPTFKGLWGRKVEIEGGGKAKADEAYFRESVMQPNAKIVKGYPASVMPSYSGVLSDDDISALIAFIKTAK